jgi:hypothetical protein
MAREQGPSPEDLGLNPEDMRIRHEGVEEIQRARERREARFGEPFQGPKTIDRVRQLQEKFLEYERRIAAWAEKHPYQSPEAAITETADSRYKMAVIQEVLTRGTVNPDALARELQEKDKELFQPDRFVNALGVIRSYIETGGEHVHGGTGLPKIENRSERY